MMQTCDIGSLSLQTEALRNSLKCEVVAWQNMYVRSLVEMSLQTVSKTTNYMKFIEQLLETPVDRVDIEQMRVLTKTIQEFHDSDANFAIEMQPLADGLHVLEQSEYMLGDDSTDVYTLQFQRWNQLQTKAQSFMDSLVKHRPQLLLAVQEEAQKISFEAMQAKSRMESHGPYAKSNDDMDSAVARMLQFTEDLTKLSQRAQICNANEKLLQAPCTLFPNINQMMAIMRHCQPVYHLYMKAKSIEKYACEIPVSKLSYSVSAITSIYRTMADDEALLDSSVQTMPVWGVYKQLASPWVHALPVLELLQSSALRPRHWVQIMQTIKFTIHPIPKSLPFGLEHARVQSSADAIDEFLSSIQGSANDTASFPSSASGDAESRAKTLSIIQIALSKISTLSLMCLVCCVPATCLNDLLKFPQMAQSEIQVEEGIERVECFMSDAVLSVHQLPKAPAIASDSEDLRCIFVTQCLEIIAGISDCRTQLLLLKQHPYAGVFLQTIQDILGMAMDVESCLQLLCDVQRSWVCTRSFISIIGNTLQPGDLRILADNQKLISRIMSQIQSAPNILDICGSSSVVPRLLPIIWQNTEALTSSVSSALLESRLKFPELFALNDFEAAEILSIGSYSADIDDGNKKELCRTFSLFPSIQGILVEFMTPQSVNENDASITMQAIQMVSDSGETYDLFGYTSACNSALDVLADVPSAAKAYIVSCLSNALQELFKQSTSKHDHRSRDHSHTWVSELLHMMPTQPVLLAIWTFFTDLIESSLERISTFASPAASSDEVFLEVTRFLGFCSREVTRTISMEDQSQNRPRLETVLTCVMALDETAKLLREKLSQSKCNGPQDFDWFCHFRYYFNTPRGSGAGNMMVEVAGVKRPYTFQPVSGTEAVSLPMVAASARVAVAVVSVVSGNMIPVLVGPAGSGKCSFIKSVAAWLGQPCLVIDARCDTNATTRWANAVGGSGYWGIVTNAHQFYDTHSSSTALQPEGDYEHGFGNISLLCQISRITRTLAECRHHGRVGGSISVQGNALSLRATAAFVICGQNSDVSPSNPFSQSLRNITRTIFVESPSLEYIFTTALRVHVGLAGSRSRALAMQLESLARCSDLLSSKNEGHPHFCKATFTKCVLIATRKSHHEGEFLTHLLSEVQGRIHHSAFSVYLDAHDALFGSVSALPPAGADPTVAPSDSMTSSQPLSSSAGKQIDRFSCIDYEMCDLLKVIQNVGLVPSPNFCHNVLNLSFNIETGHSVVIAGCPGSGRSSTILTAFAFLKSRCSKGNFFKHVAVMPEAQSCSQLFGTYDSNGGGVWLKGIFEHLIGQGSTIPYGNKQANSQHEIGDTIDFAPCTSGSHFGERTCIELDCGLSGELMDLMLPALREGCLPLNDGSCLPVSPSTLFILKGCSFERCSPTILNLVTPIFCSTNDVDTNDVIGCCLRRLSHPLKDHVLKVAIALLVPCVSSPPVSIINPSQYRHHTFSFFHALMVRLLAYDAFSHDSEKNDSYGIIGEVTASDLERFAAFACLWAAGATLNSDSRIEIACTLRANDVGGWFPADISPSKSLFDYFPVCDVITGGHWVEWSSAVPTGTPLHNILSQSSQSFNRTHVTLSPCLRRVYVPTRQSVAMTFLCDLLLPRSGERFCESIYYVPNSI
jgi:hypothetical protein